MGRGELQVERDDACQVQVLSREVGGCKRGSTVVEGGGEGRIVGSQKWRADAGEEAWSRKVGRLSAVQAGWSATATFPH